MVRKGLTLIELLIVIVIVCTLVVFIGRAGCNCTKNDGHPVEQNGNNTPWSESDMNRVNRSK